MANVLFSLLNWLLRRKQPQTEATKSHDRVFQAHDLPLVQYLDKEKTFDLLAIIEDGFSHLQTRETLISRASAEQTSTNAEVLLGLLAPFVDISLGRNAIRSSDDARQQTLTENLVHTATSLFAKLRSELRNRCLVAEVDQDSNLAELSEGEFVEFEATFQRSQFDETMSIIGSFTPLLASLGMHFQNASADSDAPSISADQIASVTNAMAGTGPRYLVANVGELRFVVVVRDDHFLDPTMSDVLDGTFRVFGKVVRVIANAEDGESINILKSSPLSRFNAGHEALGSLQTGLQGTEWTTRMRVHCKKRT